MQYCDVVRDFLRLVKVRPNRPDLDWLARLARAFHRMPYENLTKIIRLHEVADPARRPRMPDVVIADHVDFGAGGTCFSLTYFFQQILENVGYDVYPVLCDRSYGPNTHCALIARLNGKRYLVDPGYLMEAPLVVPPHGESVQKGAHSWVRLVRLGNTAQLLLITEGAGKTKIRYRLRDEPVPRHIFFEKWIDSFGWSMMRHVSVSRQTDGGLLFMRDGKLRKSTRDGKAQESIKADFANEVENVFGIDRRLVIDASDCVKMQKAGKKQNMGNI